MNLPIHASALAHPDELAYLDGANEIRYAELVEAVWQDPVMQLANVKAGDHVGWCPNNELASFLTFWAMQCRGLVACPISYRFPVATRNEILSCVGARWLPSLAYNPSEKMDRDDRWLTGLALSAPATMLLSSGSTGKPKAVVHAMAAHVASATGAAANMPLGPGDRWLWSLPLFHVSGLSILVRCAVAGATVVGRRSEEQLSADLLDKFQVTHLSVVSTQLRRLMEEDEFPSPYLKAVLLGGSSIDPRLVEAARRRGVSVMTTYGLTETASQVTTSRSDDPAETSGRILAGRELKISDEGEILVRGQTLCLGYYVEGQIQSVVDDDGWFHTRDLGVLTESNQLMIRGRIDNMFVSGGENIHPENIERAMMDVFEIEQVAVVPKNDLEFGARPVAFVDGDLPVEWEAVLRTFLQGYEIPVEIHAWPLGVEADIKISRKFLAGQLAD